MKGELLLAMLGAMGETFNQQEQEKRRERVLRYESQIADRTKTSRRKEDVKTKAKRKQSAKSRKINRRK